MVTESRRAGALTAVGLDDLQERLGAGKWGAGGVAAGVLVAPPARDGTVTS